MITSLPDGTDFNEIMYRLYVLESIPHAESEVLEGKTITQDALRKRAESWRTRI